MKIRRAAVDMESTWDSRQVNFKVQGKAKDKEVSKIKTCRTSRRKKRKGLMTTTTPPDHVWKAMSKVQKRPNGGKQE